MFSDSAKFAIVVGEAGDQRVIHTRDLGPGSTWADRVIHGVDLDDSCKWHHESSMVQYKTELSEKEDTYLMVGDKKIDSVIRESGNTSVRVKGTGESKNFYGYGKDPSYRKLINGIHILDNPKVSAKEKTFYRKRKIPRSRTKNYPVKPHTGQQRDKTDSKGAKYGIVQGEDADYHTIRVPGDDAMYACIEEEIIYGDSSQRDWSEEDFYGDVYCEDDYPIFRKSERAFVWVSHSEKYITRGGESYDYEKVDDLYYPPYDSEVGDRVVMWCPPEDWIKSGIYWDRIWSEMDYDRVGYRRAYTYTPQTDTTKARIKFSDHNL